MPDPKEPTQRDLMMGLTEALNRSNELASQNAVALEEARSLIAAQAEAIEKLQSSPLRTAPPQPALKKVPYKGLVRAKEACFIGSLRGPGDTWEHETECLWDDDPYEPCIVTSTRDDGKPNTEAHPDAPKAVPKELRPRTVDALSARGAKPLTASEW